jgi:hypothetical protein
LSLQFADGSEQLLLRNVEFQDSLPLVSIEGTDLSIDFVGASGVGHNLRLNTTHVTRIGFARGPSVLIALRQSIDIVLLSQLCNDETSTVACLVLLMPHQTLLNWVQRLEASASWKYCVDREGWIAAGAFKPITATQLQQAGAAMEQLMAEEVEGLPSKVIVRLGRIHCTRRELLSLRYDKQLNDAVINSALIKLQAKYQDEGCVTLDTNFFPWFWPNEKPGEYRFSDTVRSFYTDQLPGKLHPTVHE